MTIPMAVDVRFQQVGHDPGMKQPDPSMKMTTVFWHFARGMALAAKGKTAEAEAELKIVRTAAEQTPPDASLCHAGEQ